MPPEEDLDRFAPEYLEPAPARAVDRAIAELLAERVVGSLPPGGAALELGLGHHLWTLHCLRRFDAVTSVEGSPKLCEAARRAIDSPRWTIVEARFEEFEPEGGARFDVVVAAYVLEHVERPAALLERARDRWLAPGGTLVVVVPHALSLHRRLAVAMGLAERPGELGEADRRLGHRWCFTHDELDVLLEAAGFAVVRREGFWTKCLPNSLLEACTPAQHRGLFELGRELPLEYAAILVYQAKSREEGRR